jgi:putative glycosyltransferase (TIGR04372 family)
MRVKEAIWSQTEQRGGPRAVTIWSFVRTVRRAAYEAEIAAKPSRIGMLRRILTIRATLGFAELSRLGRRVHAATAGRLSRSILVHLLARRRAISAWIRKLMPAEASLATYKSTAGRLSHAILAHLFAHRKTIRGWIRKLMPAEANLATYKSPRLMVVSQKLIALRIPIVSDAIRRLVQTFFILLLSMEMAAGHIGGTLILARIMNLAFRPYIRRRDLPMAFLYFQALFHARQYHRIAMEISGEEEIANHYLNHILGVSLLCLSKPDKAIYYLKRAIALNDQHPPDWRMLGRAYLVLGNRMEASRCFETAVKLAPNTVMAHQNYAGRYDILNYVPKQWELREAGRLLIYDNYGQLAEDIFLLGRFEASFRLYQQMLDYQKILEQPLPAELVDRLAALSPVFERGKPVRLLPYEWVIQFGHIGLLDCYIKMARLGMYPDANYVVLAPGSKISNRAYLDYWEEYFTIVHEDDLIADLFPFQRAIGDNFMAYPGEGGMAEPWTRAAARAQIAWAEQGRAPLLSLTARDVQTGRASLAALGVPAGAWYVGLHVREGSYYGESSGGMSTHRNARIEDYFPAIKAITDRGGYVIRLGDSSMRRLPEMPRVVDYAHSRQKSPQTDIFLCASCRFIIGTTSGLTTAALSFGTPMLLVNCVSNDWQLWSADTDFIVKPIWDIRGKRTLSLAETYSQPIQGYLINALVMRRRGLEAVPNTPEDIENAVIYKLARVDGAILSNPSPVMDLYRVAMGDNCMMFGAARPVPSFLKSHPELLICSRQQAISEELNAV